MLSNWTKATTTTTGTGTLTLAAISNFPLPSKSRTTGEYVQYSIVTSDNKYESGIGKIAASDTLERTKVFSTYDGTTYTQVSASALTLASGTHTVYFTPMAESIFEPLRFPLTGPTNGSVFSLLGGGAQSNLGTAAVQRATAFPFILACSGVLTAMGINCSVAGASSTTLLGIYEAGSDGRPTRRLAKTSATLDTSTTGWKTQAVDANVRLTPGFYWVAICVTAGTNPSFTFSAGGSVPMASSRNQIISVRSDTVATDLADPFLTTSLVWGDAGGNATVWPNIGLIMS